MAQDLSLFEDMEQGDSHGIWLASETPSYFNNCHLFGSPPFVLHSQTTFDTDRVYTGLDLR